MTPRIAVRTLTATIAVACAIQVAPARAGAPMFVIDGGTTVTLDRATSLVLEGDLLAGGAFVPGPGSMLVLAGYGSPALAGVPSLASLVLALHGMGSLAQATALSDTLFLQSGWLSLSGHDLFAPVVAGGSAQSYVVTPDSLGRLARPADAGSIAYFPIGDSHYDPVSLRTGSGADTVRVAVLDAVPPQGISAATALTRAWAIARNQPSGNGPTHASIQWNASEQGPSFDRSIGQPTSAIAYRWLGSTWVAQPGVRLTDNGLDPAIDSLSIPDAGLWTLAGPSGTSAVGPIAISGRPATLQLSAPAPHPLRGEAVVRYGLPSEAEVTLTLYDVAGARRVVLAQGRAAGGWHTARLDATRIPDGVYFLRLTSGRDVRTSRCVVLR
ncbi:MAG TPA: T9SS type A sorting domain-containing protein [Gemmatimonadales bacterium]|nr:T9SS type A sorting domain-containing protein [Gemmatimonadales bacterium]